MPWLSNTHVSRISRIGSLECARDEGSRRRLLATAIDDVDLRAADVELWASVRIRQAVARGALRGLLACGGAPGLWMPRDWIRRRYSPSGMHVGMFWVYETVGEPDQRRSGVMGL